MDQITLTGMVFLAAPAGEYDRRVVLLTKEKGKITAFARGARKPSSPMVGVTTPFSFGTFSLYEGKNSYTLVSVNITNHFAGLREDMEGAYYGYYFLELADYYAREGCESSDLLKLLYQTLRALGNEHIPNRLVRIIFELKILVVNGEGPGVFSCLSCADEDQEAGRWFSVKRGGMLCEKCYQLYSDAKKILPSTAYTMRFVSATPVEKLYSFNVSDEVFAELSDIMSEYVRLYIDKKFSSLDILNTILRQ